MTDLLDLAVTAGYVAVLIAVGFALWRLAAGPSLPDRVVALDMMTVAIVAYCGIAAIDTADATFLDVGLVLALVGFLATVALARFAERQALRRGGASATTGREGAP